MEWAAQIGCPMRCLSPALQTFPVQQEMVWDMLVLETLVGVENYLLSVTKHNRRTPNAVSSVMQTHIIQTH